jgi:4-diphosphocytidyl-2-C-methyl-D-erythritol kinase
MHVRRLPNRVEVLTPAKINLFLAVLGKRPDGYHELETVLVPVNVYDSLIFIPDDRAEILLQARWGCGQTARNVRQQAVPQSAHELLFGEIPHGPQNLVWRAAQLVRERVALSRGATIQLVKRIPSQAGLGGASSDAAAALVAANEAWGLGWPRERLVALAGELGSDVPFFLGGGAAVCRGRGERIEPLGPARLNVVVVRPPVGLSTTEVYKRYRVTNSTQTAAAMTAALARGDAATVGRQLVNHLQSVASELTPWIATLQTEFQIRGFEGHQMSGSGSSYFGLALSARHGRRLAAGLRSRSLGEVIFAAT